MKKAQTKVMLNELGVATIDAITVGEKTALSEITDHSGWLKLPYMKPVFDSGWTLPVIDTPSKLTIDIKAGNNLPKSKDDREFVPIRMDDHRFVQWSDVLQGNLLSEQERCEKQGLGIQIFVVEEGNIFIDPNLDWICSRAGLQVNS
jgi:hypothetical protein